MSKKQYALLIRDLVVSYSYKPALWHIDLELPSGKVIGILGPNGSGKSTLLKAVMGLLRIDHGEVYFQGGVKLNQMRKKISYLPQRKSVNWQFPISVYEVVMMGRYPHMGFFKQPSKKDKAAVIEALHMVGMAHLADRQIGQLSGGQKEKLFFARAYVQRPDIYILDEPFSATDATTEALLMQLLQKEASTGKTILIVHHDLYAAPKYFDWAVLLNMRVIAAGAIKEVLTPALLQATYGCHTSLLKEVGEILHKQAMPFVDDGVHHRQTP